MTARRQTRSCDMSVSPTLDMEPFTKVMKELLKPLQDDMSSLKTTMLDLSTDFKAVQKSLIEVRSTANEAHEKASMASDQVIAMDKRVTVLEKALKQSLSQQSKLHEKALQMESYSRHDNLRLEGISESKGENCFDQVNEVLSGMGFDISDLGQITRAHRLGRFNPKQARPRPIIFRLLNSSDRDKIWAKRSELQGSRVWMKEDFPSEIETRRKQLEPFFRAARLGDPNYPDRRVYTHMRADRLVVNNTSFSVADIASLPTYIKSAVLNPPSLRKSDDTTIFFTRESPLSNFHPSSFEAEGKLFCSVEQYICYQKALLFDTKEVAEQMLAINDPLTLKVRANHLAKFDGVLWAERAREILKTALDAKFTQNDSIMRDLQSTGDTVIGEASANDCLFGIGMSLFNPGALDKSKWRGRNIQGEALMAIRELHR